MTVECAESKQESTMAEESKDPTPTAVASTPALKKANRRRTAIVIVAAVLVVGVLIAALYGLATSAELTVRLRDIMIIVLALTTIAIGVLLCVLIFQLQSLIVLLRQEARPIIRSANETVSTVRGTTAFLSDAVVTPIISMASYFSAIRQAVRVLAGGNRSRTPADGRDDEPTLT